MYEEKEELVSIMKQAARERLQLERQLAIAKPGPVSRQFLVLVIENHFTPFIAPEMKIVEFANSVDPDEAAHNEPPHLNLHCFPRRHHKTG